MRALFKSGAGGVTKLTFHSPALAYGLSRMPVIWRGVEA
jgi:hypothetical protein